MKELKQLWKRGKGSLYLVYAAAIVTRELILTARNRAGTVV
jgi:hypothetical protein